MAKNKQETEERDGAVMVDGIDITQLGPQHFSAFLNHHFTETFAGAVMTMVQEHYDAITKVGGLEAAEEAVAGEALEAEEGEFEEIVEEGESEEGAEEPTAESEEGAESEEEGAAEEPTAESEEEGAAEEETVAEEGESEDEESEEGESEDEESEEGESEEELVLTFDAIAEEDDIKKAVKALNKGKTKPSAVLKELGIKMPKGIKATSPEAYQFAASAKCANDVLGEMELEQLEEIANEAGIELKYGRVKSDDAKRGKAVAAILSAAAEASV